MLADPGLDPRDAGLDLVGEGRKTSQPLVDALDQLFATGLDRLLLELGQPRLEVGDLGQQGVGPGEDRITLTGVLLPDVAGDMASIDTLRRMGDTLDAHRLVDGLGRQLGDWVIDSIDETQSNFFEDGVARKTDFKLDIHRVDDPVDYTALFS